jgi:UDP:flavonoid glycosyltransferase YjiC (YdhE family)
MAAIAETSGPFSRAKTLACGLLQKGHTPAFCAAKEINYQSVEGVPEYFAPVPSPMGLPMALGKRAFGMAQRLGIQQRRKVHSFEEVLFIVGAIQEHFFRADVLAIERAIQSFKPEVVYAEFRPAAIVAARMENTPVAISYSYPARKAYAASPQYSGGVRRFVQQQGWGDIESVLDLFEWADLKIVPSCHELEPIDDPKVVFTGPFHPLSPPQPTDNPDKNIVVVYLGNGSIPYAKQLSVMKRAFQGQPYEVYIASYQATPADEGHVHVAKRFDFKNLLPSATVFINHGGQNSILSGIMAGVPQMVFPGHVFERQYNADSIARLGLGKTYLDAQFNAAEMLQAVRSIEAGTEFIARVHGVQAQLVQLGGVETAIRSISAISTN